MVIAMDYDKTLSDIKLQGLAKKILREGNEFWVVTARKDSAYNKDIMKHVLDKLKLNGFHLANANRLELKYSCLKSLSIPTLFLITLFTLLSFHQIKSIIALLKCNGTI